MSTVNQISEGFSKAWDSLSSGWREFRELAGDALTRFQPKPADMTSNSEANDGEQHRILSRASRWGLLAAEVTDTDNEVAVMLEVPGLESNDFDIEVVGNVLVVRGEKKLSRETTNGQYHVMERAYGRFERAIQLPATVDNSQSTASYQRGVLTVRLPKREASKNRRIQVAA